MSIKVTANVVEGFVGSILAKRYDDATAIPAFHKDLWSLACSDDKYVAAAAPRGHGKSTAGTLAYGLTMLLFRHSRYLVLVSDTEGQAAMFLQGIKEELTENADIADFFSLQKDEKGIKLLKDNATELIGQFTDGAKFRIVAKGANQSLRGMLWNGTRPDLIICDDMENDESVMNKDRREKLRNWFYGALLNILAPKGKLRIWGTILHNSSLLEMMMPSYTDKRTITEPLKQYSLRRTMFKAVKYRAHNEDMTKFLWPERFNKEYFVTKRDEFVRLGILDVYSQEFLNYPLDDSIAYYKKADLLEMSETMGKERMRFYITADLAISEEERSDYSVFMVAGVTENRRVCIVNVIRARMDSLEIVDTVFMLNKIYKPEAIGIEKMQVSQAIGPFLNEEMLRRNEFPHVLLMSHMNKDKPTRGKSMQARVRTRTVYFDKNAEWYPELEEELSQFPRGKKDDQADAFAYIGLLIDKMLEAPTAKEIEEEEEDDADTRLEYSGRSRTTGY